MTIRVLSVDGGGIRGLIPAVVLAEIRRRLRIRGVDAPLCSLFDLMAGTSAGALIALGLAAPVRAVRAAATSESPAYDAEEIAEIYARRGIEIFPRSRFERLRALAQAFGDKYNARGLSRLLSTMFGTVTLREALTNVLVTTYDTDNMRPMYLTNGGNRRIHEPQPDFYMRDAARASSAAPTFFEPAHIAPVPDDGSRYALIDGGVFANNPAMCAYVDARRLFPHADRIVIVSMGTGMTRTRFPYDEVRHWGFLEWMHPGKGAPLFSIMSAGQGESVNEQLVDLPAVDFFRIDGYLDPNGDHIDDAGPENIALLRGAATRIIKHESAALDRICEAIAR